MERCRFIRGSLDSKNKMFIGFIKIRVRKFEMSYGRPEGGLDRTVWQE